MKNMLLTAALCTGLVACEEAPKTETAPYQVSDTALSGHIKTLASDAFGGRAPGTPGEELTVNYITTAFKAAGLKPANGDSYVQSVPLVSIQAKGTPSLTIAGGKKALNLAFKTDQIVWTRKETSSAAIADSELVFVGYGINAPERGWNDYEGIDVKGKTVVILVNDPGYATQDDALFNGNSMTYYGRWTYKFEEAARQGAAGALVIHETKPAAYPWTTVENSWTGPLFDIVRADKGANLLDIEGWLTTDATSALFNAAGLDRAALSKAALSPGFKAVSFNLTASAMVETEIQHVTSRNVAGLIEGSTNPDEYFIYMAHWDHLGTDPTIDGDGIYNGARDNATGTAGLIELAKQFASGDQPKRSVLFLAVTAEEQGLLGSAYYAANPLVPLVQTVGGINMDGLNLYGPTHDVTVVGHGNSELDDLLTEAAKSQNRVLVGDHTPEKGYFYRSDHFELSKLGVPMLYPNPGYDHKEKGRAYVEKIAAYYVANDYHTPSDEFDPNWDLTGAVEDLQLYAKTGRLVINSSLWPNWKEGTEFKTIRDTQRAGK
ncbi:MAG: M28 family peptidase [Kordiimonadaceae bacterium]|nr:M28 family peptidase [Kordiimonadaceae bacterium]